MQMWIINYINSQRKYNNNTTETKLFCDFTHRELYLKQTKRVYVILERTEKDVSSTKCRTTLIKLKATKQRGRES